MRNYSIRKQVLLMLAVILAAAAVCTCYVYAYAQNGVYKKIKVTVK